MKKAFLLIAFLASIVLANAQESSTYDYKIDYAGTWNTYFMPSTSYANTLTDSTWYYTVLKESDAGLRYQIKVSLDSIGGVKKKVAVVLKAKQWDSDSYTTVTTTYWWNGRDTTILFTQTSTAQYYRYFQVFVQGVNKGFVFKIPELSFGFKK